MRWCRTVDLLFRILPFSFWRDFLIRRHIEGCDGCRASLVSADVARSLIYNENDFEQGIDLWPRVGPELNRSSSSSQKKRGRTVFRNGMMASAAAVLVACLLLIWNIAHKNTPEIPVPEESFRIQSIQIDNEPAQAFLYQSADSDMVFVWAEKNVREEIFYE